MPACLEVVVALVCVPRQRRAARRAQHQAIKEMETVSSQNRGLRPHPPGPTWGMIPLDPQT